MAQGLAGKKVAIRATDGVAQVALTKPLEALKNEGATVEIVAPHGGEIQGFKHLDKGDMVKVDRTLDEASPDNYDAIMLPGGVANPDQLRMIPKAVSFARHFFDAQKPIAVICHGPWTLLEAGVVKDLEITSWPSLKTDLENAGARWVDQQVVVDSGVVSSRKPDDIPTFCKKMVEEFREGRHTRRQAAE